MKPTAYTVVVSAALSFALPLSASAGKFSWFDETPARDTLGQLRPPSSLFDRSQRLTFGLDAYKSLAASEDAERSSEHGDVHVVSVYGEMLRQPNNFYSPLAVLNRDESALADGTGSRLSGFGIKWQHRVDPSNTLAFTAGYSESPWLVQPLAQGLGIFDTRAAVSWTSTWAGDLRPGMTGSVFVGDESIRDESMYQRLARKYMGFALGGQLQVAQDHTPYFSYRMQRRYYSNVDDPAYTAYPYDDRSQIAAGWRWQVQSNWSVHAEAAYGLNGVSLDPYTADRSRVFFGTRFDFR
jgi:hypothetical protein